MPSFVVYVNGNRVCSVGLTGNNTGTIDLMWVGNQKKDDQGLIFFHLGSTEGNENLRWSVPQLRVGDEVIIKLAESTVGDPPSSRKTVEEIEHQGKQKAKNEKTGKTGRVEGKRKKNEE